MNLTNYLLNSYLIIQLPNYIHEFSCNLVRENNKLMPSILININNKIIIFIIYKKFTL
jgi:hypothetical protein